MSNAAPLSSGFGRWAPRQTMGPLSGGQLDHVPGQGENNPGGPVGWGFSPWGTSSWGWGDERVTVPQLSAPRRQARNRVFPLARRGTFHRFPIPEVAAPAVQQDAPDRIRSPRTTRVFTLARRGQVHHFPTVGRAPGQLDTPDRIVPANRRRTFSLARRGQFFEPPVTHPRVPDRIESRNARVFVLARRGRFSPVRMVGFAPGQVDTPPFLRQSKRQVFALARTRGHLVRTPLGRVGWDISDATSTASSANKTAVSSFTALNSGQLERGFVRCFMSAGSTTANVVVYADSAGAPGALLAQTDNITVASTVEIPLSAAFTGANKISLTQGDTYWIGVSWQDPGVDSFTFFRGGTASARQESSSYLPNPFGAPAAFTGPVDAWVEVTGTAVVVPVVQQDAPDSIHSPRATRVFTLSRTGEFFEPPWREPGYVAIPSFIRQTRRPQLPSRGWKHWGPPTVGLAPGQFVVPDRIDSQRSRTYTARRGQFIEFAPPAPFVVPDRITSQRDRTYIPRRGSFFRFRLVGLAPGQFVVPDRIDSQRPRTYTARRGSRTWPLEAIVVAPPGTQAKPPDAIRPANRRRTFVLARRGDVAFFPKVGSGLGYQTAWVPSMRSQRVRQLALRRGDQWVPVPVQGKVPDRVEGSRVRQLSVRRGSGWELPYSTYGPPPARIIRSGSRPGADSTTPRRRRYYDTPKPIVVTGPPSRVTSRRPRGVTLRRGRFLFFSTSEAFAGPPAPPYVILVPSRLVVDIDPDAVRLAVETLVVSLENNPTALRIARSGEALQIVLDADGSAWFLHDPSAKIVIVRQI